MTICRRHLGARAARAGLRCVYRPELWALHVWHPKPPKAMVENQRNLDQYLRRHGDFLRDNGFGDLIEIDVDWTLWWHYHAQRGGRVARAADGLWAVSADAEHRLALPDLDWLPQLGHCVHESGDVLHNAERVTDHGTATEKP